MTDYRDEMPNLERNKTKKQQEFVVNEELTPNIEKELKQFIKNLAPSEITVARIWYVRGAIAQQKIYWKLTKGG